MMRIAVLGAGGFVGSRMVELARLTGRFEAVPVIRSPKSAARLARFGPVWRIADAAVPAQLGPVITGCDAVVNLTIGDFGAMADAADAVWQTCAAHGVPRLVHLSTAEVFGRVEDAGLHDDSPPLSNHWMAYALAKAAAEARLRSRFADRRVACTILRPGLIWGPRSPWVEEPARALAAGTAFLVGAGEGVCNLIYVDNLIQQILSVIQHPTLISGCYNIADDELTNWRAYYTALAAELKVEFSRIHQLPDGPFRPTLGSRFANLKQSTPASWLKKRLTRTAKLKLKGVLAKFQTPPPTSGPVPVPQPELTRGAWHQQTVQHKLSNRKFRETFGRHGEVSFVMAMARSGEWMRFSGFADL